MRRLQHLLKYSPKRAAKLLQTWVNYEIMYNTKLCPICGKLPKNLYMVTDTVWNAASFSKRQCACIGCVEIALRRPLRMRDFPNLPINSNIRFGYKMGEQETKEWQYQWKKRYR